ncbi:lysophospholipid acyltransferase family protein [Desulfocurvibacter africanus]|uniref:1-acyl-sn-glycerol-3-phosphate acyltransferase n=1 Tax=Desulfocurvibacter africanus subsp. africanus str. Walvis Bay TaxID=690850 RepID=F3Z1B6_DESAF|nr:lysophospholipid acyltransferase family protein [Desulfocurvibacter africanus]EGJ51119.1 1-acyl-sn-glycerol-3-phosphate acyltransferase [Desulfocurvibacter africanus subsp. africanus str. Walvis Bay]
MLRTIIFFTFYPLVTVVSSTLCILFGRSFANKPADLSQRIWAKACLALAGIKVEADFSALAPGQTYVFMANHQSNFDIPLLTACLDQWSVRMVAKDSLFKIPVFGWALRRVGHISIDRAKMRKAMQAIQEAVEIANSGISIVIFPEGTRSRDFSQLQEFKAGGFILAIKTGLPVAPVVMSGSGEIMPKGHWFIRPGTVRIKALPPVAPGSYSLKEREQFKENLQQAMSRAYLEMHRHGG